MLDLPEQLARHPAQNITLLRKKEASPRNRCLDLEDHYITRYSGLFGCRVAQRRWATIAALLSLVNAAFLDPRTFVPLVTFTGLVEDAMHSDDSESYLSNDMSFSDLCFFYCDFLKPVLHFKIE